MEEVVKIFLLLSEEQITLLFLGMPVDDVCVIAQERSNAVVDLSELQVCHRIPNSTTLRIQLKKK